MSNPFDQFDTATKANPFDQFDTRGSAPAKTVRAKTKGKDGKPVYFDVAADANDETVQQAAMKATNDPRRRSVDRGNLPKDDSKARGFIAGALKPLDKAAGWLAETSVGKAVDRAGVAIGLPSAADAIAGNKEARANNSRTGYQTLGNIAGTLPTLALPGGALAQGGATGALLSDKDTLGGTAVDAATGAAAGYGAGKVLSGMGALAKGVTDPALRAISKAGVPLTIGQIGRAANNFTGKTVAKVEDAMTSVFGLGDIVTMARNRGTEGLNVAVANRILGNVGDKLPKGTAAGHDMVEAVQTRLSNRYTALVPQLRGVTDVEFARDLTAAKALTATLPPARQDQFESIVRDVFTNRTNGARISGQALKDAESRLTFLANKYGKSMDADQAILGEAVNDVRQALRAMVQRSNPAHAKELQGLNTAWAQLKGLRKAAFSAGNNDTGVATPAALLRESTRGGYRDPFLESAKRILPSKLPESGTATRALGTLGVIGAAGGTGALAVSPWAAIPAAASMLYTKPGMSALNAVAFGNRGAVGAVSAKALENLSKYAPGVTVAATPYLLAKSNE